MASQKAHEGLVEADCVKMVALWLQFAETAVAEVKIGEGFY